MIKAMKIIKSTKGEYGIGALLSIAIALIVTVFVLVPGVRNFAELIIEGLNSWWTTVIAPEIFPSA